MDVEARPDNPKHRAGLKVSAEDDIEDVAVALFGQDHLFKRATSLARIVIAVKYTPVGESKAKTLNITLSELNRCNLRSNRDPVQRDLGYALLSAWNILRSVEPMTPDQKQSAFPALLQLYDQTSKEVAGQFFLSRKLNLDELLTAGFIEKRGRHTTFRLEDEGIAQEVDVWNTGPPGMVYYEHPVDGARVELPITAVEKYALKRDWLNAIVLKKLGAFLVKVEPQRLDENLILLGQIKLGADFQRNLNSDRARISFGFGAPSANDLDAESEDSALDDSTEPLWSQDQDLFAQSDTLHDLQIALAYMNDEQRNLFELLKVHQTLPDACKACGTASATFYRRFADL